MQVGPDYVRLGYLTIGEAKFDHRVLHIHAEIKL